MTHAGYRALAALLLLSSCTAQFAARGGGAIQPAPAPPPMAPRETTVPAPQPPLVIAGTPVVRVGVNFEDMGQAGDRDYNDAVMCFQGAFKVDGTQVVSTEAQQVTATTWSHSDCRHRVRVEITHADGRREPAISFDSNAGVQVPMRFEVGSQLAVFVQTFAGGCGRDEMSMHETANAQVLLDRCNSTGQ